MQSSSSLDDIKSAVAFAARHYEIIEELRQCGFDKTQINAIEEVIRAAAQQDVEITQYLNTDYSVDELNELSKPLIAYINANIIDRMSNVGNVVNNLTDTIDLINDRLNERKFYENHEYNAAQKNAIAECVANGMSWDALQEIDESFSAEQIHTLADMFIKAIKGDIEPSSITDFVNDVKSGKYDETSMLRLKEISDEISNIKSDIAQKISGMNAAEISLFIKVQLDRLTVLEREQERLEKYLQDQPIGQSDIDRLRAIEPKRKSVQNLLDTEVAQVPKFEKQQADKMGERSAFEMRKSDNAWRNDESRTVPVISVAEYSIPDKIQLLRKDSNIERGTFVNADTGISITFGRNCLDEIVSKTIEDDKHKMPVKARVCSLYHVQEIIENAICFDSTISEYDANTSKNKSPNTLFMHRMYGAINYQDDLYLVSLAVEEMYHTDINNKFSGTKNRLYSLRDIKITPTEELGGQTHFSLSKDKSTSSLGANISIPQLYSLVKTYDKNFYENPSAVGRAERLNELEIDRTVQAAVVQYAEPENDVTLSPLDTKSETQEIEFTAISEMDLTKQLDSLTAAALDRHSDLMLMLKNNFELKNVDLRSFADNHIDKLVYDLPMPDNEAFMLYYFSDKHHDSIVDDIFQKAYKETERLLKIEKFAKENGIPYSDNGNVDAEIGAEVLDLHMISKHGEPMVGFPDIKKDEFSEKLKRAGYSVVTDEQSALLNAAASAEEEAQISGLAKDDFTITDNSLGEGGAKAKFKANIEAIKCLKALESEHRPTTSEEKEILSKYVGWGGISQAFDSENKCWSNEYKQLKELLTDDEFTAACESTLNSFYTSPIVIERQNGYKSVFK